MSVRAATPRPAPARAHRLDDVLRIGMSMPEGGGGAPPHYYALVDGVWRRYEGLPPPYPRRSDDIPWFEHRSPYLVFGPEGGLTHGNAYVETSPNHYVPYDAEQQRLWEERRAAARQRAIEEYEAWVAAEEARNNNMPELAQMQL